MCGRYAMAPEETDWGSLASLLGEDIQAALAALAPRYNIAPSTNVPAIAQHPETGELRLLSARWGFIPHWWKEVQPPKFSTINARSEEAAGKPLWRDAFRRRRCLMPFTHWYEWRKQEEGKQAYALHTTEKKVSMFAGLYSRWTPPGSDASIHTVAILTRKAADSVHEIHDRMPVVLDPAGWRAWLDPALADKAAVAELLDRHAVSAVSAYPVSNRVNSPRNQDSELLQPLA